MFLRNPNALNNKPHKHANYYGGGKKNKTIFTLTSKVCHFYYDLLFLKFLKGEELSKKNIML